MDNNLNKKFSLPSLLLGILLAIVIFFFIGRVGSIRRYFYNNFNGNYKYNFWQRTNPNRFCSQRYEEY